MQTFVRQPPADPGAIASLPALHAALQEELGAQAFFRTASMAFGGASPWSLLASASDQRIQALLSVAQQLNLSLPIPPAPGFMPIEPGWRQNVERALHGCMSGAALYQRLIEQTPHTMLQNTFQRLQAELLNNHLPLLQGTWQAAADRERYHAMQGVSATEAYTSHGLIGDTMEQVLALLTRQGGMFGLLGTVLRSTQPALLAGLFTGGAAIQGVRKLRTPAGTAGHSSQKEA
ncbi:MAG: hypothetical protein Q4D19_09785 [Lautropia sp.]|nr:hypothetical protein [Lautropia sp.]